MDKPCLTAALKNRIHFRCVFRNEDDYKAFRAVALFISSAVRPKHIPAFHRDYFVRVFGLSRVIVISSKPFNPTKFCDYPLYDFTSDTFSIPDSLCNNIEEPGACTDCNYLCICPHFDTDEGLTDGNVDVSDELKSDILCSSVEESLKGELENALKSSGDPIMNSESSACPEKNYPATEFVTCYDINNCPAKLTEGKKYEVVAKNENSFTIQDDNGVLAVLNRVRFQLPRITQIFKEAKYVAVDVDFWVKCVSVPTPDSSLVVGTVYHVSKVVNNHYGIDLVFFDRPSTVPFEKHFFVPCEPPEAIELLSTKFTAPKSPEEILLVATADLWNSYTKLPEFHPMEFTEVAGAIHHIQGWLAIRLNSKSDNSSFSRKVSK